MEIPYIKVEAIAKLKTSDIEKVLDEDHDNIYKRLMKLFKDDDLTKEEILDLVGIIFVIESLILSERMRDVKLTNLEQGEVENLAMELYLVVERRRSRGDGYGEMCEIANEVISKHLSSNIE